MGDDPDAERFDAQEFLQAFARLAPIDEDHAGPDAEPKRLQVTGAALAVGGAPSPGEDQAAKSFFEDLLRRGRLKVPKAAKSAAEVVRAAAPSTHESHTHELRREGRQMVLRRVRIDCGFAHR